MAGIAEREIANLKRWRDVGDGPVTYTAGSKQFGNDVIVALREIERLRSMQQGYREQSAFYAVENADLRAAFLKYARHTSDCRHHGGHDCSCGLDELRAACKARG